MTRSYEDIVQKFDKYLALPVAEDRREAGGAFIEACCESFVDYAEAGHDLNVREVAEDIVRRCAGLIEKHPYRLAAAYIRCIVYASLPTVINQDELTETAFTIQ
jgi:hypothetical protein